MKLLINSNTTKVRDENSSSIFLTRGYLMEINEGDTVKVVCNDKASIEPKEKVFKGIVQSIFNALDKDGDNWFFEIRGFKGEWFLYKPRLDGGTITVIKQ